MAEQIDLRAQHVMGQHSRIGSIVQQRRFRLTLHPQLVHGAALLRCSLAVTLGSVKEFHKKL